MKETNVIRTHIYGKTPYDVYSVLLTGSDGNQFNVELGNPTLDVLATALGDSFIQPDEVEDTIENLESAAKTTFATEDKLEFAKDMLGRAITIYDTSDAVNGFYLVKGGMKIHYWLPAVQRNQLVTSVTSWSDSHDDYKLDLREFNTSLPIPCNTLLQMLSRLETYAVECYNVTSKHLSAVSSMEDMESVVSYDYKSGYPAKLEFEV